MARSKRSAKLDSRNKRLTLEAGKRFLEPIQAGAYILYQRPQNGAAGAWLARWYDPESRKQKQTRLGSADDFNEADGLAILTYAQAQAKAETWFRDCARFAALAAGGELLPQRPYSVADAISDYLRDAKRRGMKGLKVTDQTAAAHIVPSLGDLPVAKLTKGKLETWHLALAETPRRKTGKVRKVAEHLEAAKTDEDKRKRKNTANRILTILKAALNQALLQGKVSEPAPWREVKPFKAVTSSRIRFLTVGDQLRLVSGCNADFLPLVQAALLTGARYGELTRLRVQDFNPTAGTVFIEISKSGKSRHIWLTDEGSAWFAAHTADRPAGDLLLTRAEVKRTTRKEVAAGPGWAPYDQVYAMALACEAAEIPPLTFHELRHTYASTLVNRGVPLAYVAAQLGHTDTRMVERYYGHLCPNAQAEAIRKLAPKLGFTHVPTVVPLKITGKGA